MPAQPLACTPKSLPRSKWIAASEHAARVNPGNRPPVEKLSRAMRGFTPTPMHLAVVTRKYWGAGGVKLTVAFLDGASAELRKRILSHMNAWSKYANVSFVPGNTDPDVRVAREGGRDGGYWSYLGTDIHQIDDDEPTMNLEAFTMQTPESEFVRVVRHEAGHTLGFPHEHMRKALVSRIDRKKAIKHFMATQGWSQEEVIAQVLTPLEEGSLIATGHADSKSIMCYQIPGSLTKSGRPILGGDDIDKKDGRFAAKIYPKKVSAARPDKPGSARRNKGNSTKRRKRRA